MQPNEINTAIVELACIYDNLNKRWSNDPCSTDAFQAFRQTEYHEIYEKIRNTNIESLALGIIANSLDERILMRLRNLLNDNIQIYETRQNNFANINSHKVYSLHEEQLFADKFALLAKDKEEIQGFLIQQNRKSKCS